MKSNSEIKNVAKLFLKLGFTAFGGPTDHIAIMYNEVKPDDLEAQYNALAKKEPVGKDWL